MQEYCFSLLNKLFNLFFIKFFQDQLLKESRENNVIPEKAVCDIFSNLSSIYKFHSELLLPELEKRLQKW